MGFYKRWRNKPVVTAADSRFYMADVYTFDVCMMGRDSLAKRDFFLYSLTEPQTHISTRKLPKSKAKHTLHLPHGIYTHRIPPHFTSTVQQPKQQPRLLPILSRSALEPNPQLLLHMQCLSYDTIYLRSQTRHGPGSDAVGAPSPAVENLVEVERVEEELVDLVWGNRGLWWWWCGRSRGWGRGWRFLR